MVKQFLDSKVVEERVSICKTCTNNKVGICTLCGCVIAFKTRLTLADCPDKKWDKNVEILPINKK